MTYGRQPRVNEEINWVTDEDGNVIGNMSPSGRILLASVSRAANVGANPVNAVIFGDSLSWENGPNKTVGSQTTYSALDTGWFNWFNAKMGGAFTVVANLAIVGKRSDEVLAEQVPAVLSSGAQVAFMVGPATNDVSQTVAADVTIGYLQQIYDAVLSAGIQLVVLTVPALNTVTAVGNAKILKIGAWQKSYARANPKLLVVDAHAVTVDPASASGQAKANYLRSADNTHFTQLCARAIGEAAYARLSGKFLDVNYHVSSMLDVKATDASAVNLLYAPLLNTGTAGALSGAGVTGTVASSWQVVVTAGAPTSSVCSLLDRADGYGKNQRVVITAAAAGDEVAINNNDLARNFVVPGSSYRGEAFVTITGASNLVRMQLSLTVTIDGATYVATWGAQNVAMTAATYSQADVAEMCIPTPVLPIPAGASVTATKLQLALKFGGAGGATVDIGRASVSQAS